MFRWWVEISRWSAALAFASFILLFSGGFGAADLIAQDVTGTPVPVKPPTPPKDIGGVIIQDLNPALAQQLDIPPNMPGIVVMDVNEWSPAGESGILPGDIIVAVNSNPVQSVSELYDVIWATGLSPVVFQVVRGDDDYAFTFPVW